jgi:hypothetical protein
MIASYSFGKMEIEGRTYTHDLKTISGRVIGDWWRTAGRKLAGAFHLTC